MAEQRPPERLMDPGSRDQRFSRNYRPDIDGLRALSVLSIVLCHLGLRHAAGGFVGVDVFFIISGYLIGGAVMSGMADGSFSIRSFYYRRIGRIFPALVVMLLLVSIASIVMIFPRPLVEYGYSLIFTILSASNMYFWRNTGYFDSLASSKILLHTWSLGVEEQFYIVFPILIYVIDRLRIRVIWAVLALVLISLMASIAALPHAPAAAFYWFPLRAWELMLGVVVKHWDKRALPGRWLREALAAIALAAIILPILAYTPQTPFPGLTALVPCLGTAALLFLGAQSRTLVGRALSLRPVVFIGLISYSLYLWHWPVIVLIQQAVPEGWLRMPERAAALSASLLLAWLSWLFVERPFRSRRISPRAMFVGAGCAAALIVIGGLTIVASQGLPARYPARVVQLADYINHSPAKGADHCFLGPNALVSSIDYAACLAEDPARPNVIVLGDSHAAHLMSGLRRRYPGIYFAEATASGCQTTLPGASNEGASCRSFRDLMFNDMLPRHRDQWVLLSNFWGEDGIGKLDSTLDWFKRQGIRVILAGPVVRYEVPLPLALATAELRGTPSIVDKVRISEPMMFDKALSALAAAHGVPYMSSYAALCEGPRCQTVAPSGEPVQLDYGHLSPAGSLLVATRFPASLVEARSR